jgi:nitrite reductase/ring-hydroxylating ferredoxin subunit
MSWTDLVALADLEAEGKALCRHDGRQILVVKAPQGIFAVPNRCPHEGYPLSEGVLSEGALAGGCVLTCHWHNWKFDLASGDTLVGGDRLVRYPIRVEGGRVLADLAGPDPKARRAEILANVTAALERFDEQRLVRETARLARLGADPVDAVRTAIAWLPERLEFGMTHALAGAPDWLDLHDAAEPDSPERLVALGEILGHVAEDALFARRAFPYPADELPWDAAAFLAAIERESEAEAVKLLRGALAAGLSAGDLLPALAEAALAHYADFGHSLIYAVQGVRLIRRLGPDSAEPVLSMLARALVYATREDLLPEFRDYARRRAEWGSPAREAPPLAAAALERTGPRAALAAVAAWGAVHRPEAIFAVLVEAAARILLSVDPHWLERADARLADNVGWLDFTHALTFAEAGRAAAALRPDLWPAVLLQLACFVGRNAGYAAADFDEAPWRVEDVPGFLAAARARLYDHGRERYIVSVHLVKTLQAGAALAEALPDRAPAIAAALNRFLASPVKRHTLRTAIQMRDLVAEE